jgi:hypothetical protein
MATPQFREFPFETDVFEKCPQVEQAILIAVAESYLQGISPESWERSWLL